MGLHPSAHRLLDALLLLRQVDGHAEPGKVASLLGESPATITNWKARGVSKAGSLKAGELFGVNPVWIRSGEGQMTQRGAFIPNMGDALHDRSNLLFLGHSTRIPRLSWGEVARYCAGMLTIPEERHEAVASPDVTRRCFLIEVDGDAMVGPTASESIPQGSTLLCDPDRTPEPGDVVIALHPRTQEPLVRSLVKEAGVWYLRAHNVAYPMLEIASTDALIARAIEVITRRTL